MSNAAKEEIVIDIGPDGAATGLHFDEFPLNILGDMEIKRASSIVWDESNQLWTVVLADREERDMPDPCFGWHRYDDARDFEVKWLQECMKAEVKPLSKEGLRFACCAAIHVGKSCTVIPS